MSRTPLTHPIFCTDAHTLPSPTPITPVSIMLSQRACHRLLWFLKGWERAIVNQTNAGTVSKATLGNFWEMGWSACTFPRTGSKRACLLVQHFWISKGMFFSTTLLDLKRACLLVQHFCIVCVNTVTIFKLKNDPQTSCYLVKLCFNGISNSMLLVLPLIP